MNERAANKLDCSRMRKLNGKEVIVLNFYQQ